MRIYMIGAGAMGGELLEGVLDLVGPEPDGHRDVER